MEMQWEEFTQKTTGNPDLIRVSLNGRGIFALNKRAVDLLGSPDAIVLMYDKTNNLIGLKASTPEVHHAYELKQQGKSQTYYLRAKAFCNYYGIDIGDTVVFNDVQMDDGMMVLQLANVTYAGRPKTVAYHDDIHEPDRPAQSSKFSTLLRMKIPGDE